MSIDTISISITEENISVSIKILMDQREKKGIASVKFGPIKINGFKIMESQYPSENGEDPLWVAPPAYQGKTKFINVFWMENKILWKKIERKIIEKYHVALELKKNGYSQNPKIQAIAEKYRMEDPYFS